MQRRRARERLETEPASSSSRDSKDATISSSNDLTLETNPTSIPKGLERSSKKAALNWTALLFVIINSSWLVYHFQFERLPLPLTAAQAGKRGFSELRAVEHVKALTGFGPHPVGSDALDRAVKYVLSEAQRIEEMAHWDVEVEVDYFQSKPGVNRLKGGLFGGRTLIYSNLKHVVMRITPKYATDAENNAVLVSSHIDTVFSTEGAGDCSSCVAVMLELARGLSHWAHGFTHSVIFLFNTGEEEGLDGAHSFITQHPWNSTIRTVVDVEAMGIGGKSSLFQGGPDPWIVETFARVAKHPSAQILSQDIFHSGAIKSATDFQVYMEVAGLSGLDFAYMDFSSVYHTKNDKLDLLKPGSLQHLGDNMLALLCEVLTSPHLQNMKSHKDGHSDKQQIVYFDVVGKYMVTYSQKFANMLFNSIILQSLLIWTVSLVIGGTPAVICLCLACFSIFITWILSMSFSALVALCLPHLCSSPLPYIASPWLLVGLFGAPALLGALFGHHIGYITLQKYLLQLEIKKNGLAGKDGVSKTQVDCIRWEAQRWLFKAGFVQWLLILLLGMRFKAGSSYIAFIWLVSPSVAYGLMEATLSPIRPPKELKTSSFFVGHITPIVVTAGVLLRLIGILIGVLVRFDRNPGNSPEWLGSLIIAMLIAAIVCVLLVYLLPYAHCSGGLKWIIMGMSMLFLLTFSGVVLEIFPTFTKDVGRALSVVHVVETPSEGESHSQSESYISLSSLTPGKLTKEIKYLNDENFVCGRDKPTDFVTYSVNYGCVSSADTSNGWSERDRPVIQVQSDDIVEGKRKTVIFVDTMISIRWVMAINSMEIEGFKLEMATAGDTHETLVPEGDIDGVDGWHTIQFVSNKGGPTKFVLSLFWHHNFTNLPTQSHQNKENDLIKLRTDLNTITPKVARILEKLPDWCVLFGKSTSPYTLSYLSSLSVSF
ncbi:hypothetical protein SUGI_1133080 [Cryptomeria japonica]|uniref:uncharacterized protein LOC131032482 isoform X2 n=1 Tax=Cryptomeria japonica TaxID=3369 RepID=UPI002414C1EA|nr:uncharacterized protein LOC131032482 isoform X2 [Cryptomeria japonica]GLJ53167.1 hypothetical protein SUGI_1133080 [Cryptomeria japonica]